MKKSSERYTRQAFLNFWKAEELFGPCQKNCYKSCLLHPDHLKIYTTHFWILATRYQNDGVSIINLNIEVKVDSLLWKKIDVFEINLQLNCKLIYVHSND